MNKMYRIELMYPLVTPGHLQLVQKELYTLEDAKFWVNRVSLKIVNVETKEIIWEKK